MAAANARLADLHDAARCRNVVPRRSFSVRSRMAATLRRTANRIEPCVTQPCGSAGRAA
ncbi:hypothetical protein [Rhodococcus rhodnii]|nr:hypothetical protein [Rhodococcus rhodnii]